MKHIRFWLLCCGIAGAYFGFANVADAQCGKKGSQQGGFGSRQSAGFTPSFGFQSSSGQGFGMQTPDLQSAALQSAYNQQAYMLQAMTNAYNQQLAINQSLQAVSGMQNLANPYAMTQASTTRTSPVRFPQLGDISR